MPKLSSADKAYRSSFFTSLLVIFIICFGIGLAALILTGVLYTKTNGNEICANCEGIVNSVVTDNGTLSPINSQSLSFHGINGIRVGLNDPTIVIDDKRWISEYIVRQDGTGEFLSPQEAYNQAILDGRGGTTGLPAVIIIGPGIYDYGDTQFQVTTIGISFVALPGVIGSSGAVIFKATGLNGGIHIDIPLDITNGVIFQGITFGDISDTNGFLLNHTQGQCSLYECASLDSNFRIVTGGTGPFTILGMIDCAFQTLPPNDFVTTMDQNTVVVVKNVQWTQLGFGANVSSGGYLFNLANGIGELRMWNSFMVFNLYNGVFQGPLSGISGEGLISVIGTQIIINDAGNLVACFLRQTGSNNVVIDSSYFSLQGPLIYQIEDSVAGDAHDLHCSNTVIFSKNATIGNEASVTIIGNNNYQFFNTYMKTNPDPLVINIPTSTIPDVLNVIFTGVTVDSNSLPLGNYAQGPGALVATIKVGTSTSVSGSNNAAGFAYTPLTAI